MDKELVQMPSLSAQSSLERRVMRNVAHRLIPFLAIAYLLDYLNRSNIAVAKLTMSADLGLTETMYGLTSGLFFNGYNLTEVGIPVVVAALGLGALARPIPASRPHVTDPR